MWCCAAGRGRCGSAVSGWTLSFRAGVVWVYTAAGADLDVARVRALLRPRGIRRVTANRSSPGSWPELTEAELRVAQLAATGSANRTIVGRMHVSPHTVNSHLRHIFDKFGLHSRVALTRLMTGRSRSSS